MMRVCCDFSPQSIFFKHISCSAQLLIGVKQRDRSVCQWNATHWTPCCLITQRGGSEGGRLDDELCTHAVLVSLSIHAQRGITRLLLLGASHQQHSVLCRIYISKPAPLRDISIYRIGSFREALIAHNQAGLSMCRQNITALYNQIRF